MATIVESDSKSPFRYLLHQGVGEGATPFPGLLHFTLDLYLIMLSVKQGGIKYYGLSLSYDSTWDWTQLSKAIGEHYSIYRKNNSKNENLLYFYEVNVIKIIIYYVPIHVM